MGMQPAICNEMFADWPLDRICEFVQSLGYRGIELAPFTLGDQPTMLSPARRQELTRIVRDSGLEVVGLHWLLAQTRGYHLTSDSAAVRQRTSDYLRGLIDLNHDLGGQLLVFGSPQQRELADGVTTEEGEARASEVLEPLRPLLESTGCVLALEPLGPEETNFWNTAADVRSFLQRFDCQHVRLHLDVKAMSTEGITIDQIIEQSEGVLAHFHANDPNRLGPGMGEIDYAPIFPALHRIGYEGWLSVEVFDFSPGPERIARESLDYLRRFS